MQNMQGSGPASKLIAGSRHTEKTRQNHAREESHHAIVSSGSLVLGRDSLVCRLSTIGLLTLDASVVCSVESGPHEMLQLAREIGLGLSGADAWKYCSTWPRLAHM